MSERSTAFGLMQERPTQPDLNGHNGKSSNALKSSQGLYVSGADKTRSKMGLVIPGERPGIDAMIYPKLAEAEFVRVNPYMVAVDMRRILKDINPNWQNALLEVAREQPMAEIVPGFDPTSMAEPRRTPPTYYRPTTQSVIKDNLAWAHSLFENEIRFLAERLMKDRSIRLGVGESALNMNFTKKGPYELHVDRNPLTALLGVTDVQEGLGGELVVHERRNKFGLPEGKQYRIRPQAGMLYFFMGNKHPHEVTPYFGFMPRVVMPGDYYSESKREIIDTIFDGELGLIQQDLARERLPDGGKLLLVNVGTNGHKGNGREMRKNEPVTLIRRPTAA